MKVILFLTALVAYGEERVICDLSAKSGVIIEATQKGAMSTGIEVILTNVTNGSDQVIADQAWFKDMDKGKTLLRWTGEFESVALYKVKIRYADNKSLIGEASFETKADKCHVIPQKVQVDLDTKKIAVSAVKN